MDKNIKGIYLNHFAGFRFRQRGNCIDVGHKHIDWTYSYNIEKDFIDGSDWPKSMDWMMEQSGWK